MPLPILLLSILASASALPYFSIDDLPLDDLPIDKKIPALKEFEDPQFLAAVQEDTLTTLELIKKFGYNGELHEVMTSDGYILEMHRITGRTNVNNSQVADKPVAFVMHGLLCSSACWVLSGPEKSLAFILTDAGYDVWLGNVRGNVYARRHLLPDIEEQSYWNFSWHEIGTRDLPAMIDYVIKATGREKIFYLGHSQGTTSFFVMASEEPEYQDKIQAMFALAPVAYCGRIFSPIFKALAGFSGPINGWMELIGMYEFLPNTRAMTRFKELVCAEDAFTQPLCRNVLFLIAGFDKDQYNAVRCYL